VGIVANLLSADDQGFETSIGTWTAGANTSVARTTAQFQTGAASMRLTSAAAGAMIASTGKYTGVTAGSTYMAYLSAANAVAAAGRTLVSRIDWYTSGDVLISSSTATIPWVLGNDTGWSSPIIVVGTAPATTAKAALTVQVTAGITGAGQAVAVDTCGLGPVNAVPGNVLGYNAESCEMDVADWSVSNGTLARISGGAFEGAFRMRATSTASGNMPITTSNTARWPVAAGVAYETSVWVTPPASGRTLILEARWYTAASGGTLLSTSSRTVTTTQAATWERHTLLAAAPASATHVVMALRPQPTAGSEVWYFDVAVHRPEPLLAGNLLSYAAQSIEVDASDWTAAANCSIAQSAPSEPYYAGGASLKATAAAAGQVDVAAAAVVPVTAGTYYLAQTRFRTVGATLSIVWMDVDWYDASMVWLGRAQPDQDSVGAGDTWRLDRIGRAAPAGAAFARLHALPQATSGGQVFYLDEFSLAPGIPPYTVEADQATASVAVTLNSLAGFSTVSLWRIGPDGSRMPVRGYGSDVVAYPVTGPTMVFVDYEAPLGVQVRYEYQRDAGSTTRTPAVTVDPPADPAYVWLTDPGEPARNQLVMVESAPDWSEDAPRGVYRVQGSRMPVVTSDVRQSRSGDLTVLTWTQDEDQALRWLLETGSVLLLRARSDWGLDYLYVSVGGVGTQRLTSLGSEPGRRRTLALTEVARPVGGMAGSATRTWQDVKDDVTATTWGAVRTTYATWLEVLQGVD
jgi:hypothetical protein